MYMYARTHARMCHIVITHGPLPNVTRLLSTRSICVRSVVWRGRVAEGWRHLRSSDTLHATQRPELPSGGGGGRGSMGAACALTPSPSAQPPPKAPLSSLFSIRFDSLWAGAYNPPARRLTFSGLSSSE